MNVKQARCAAAVTLVEVMVAIAILAAAAVGVLSYQFHASGQGKIARAQICGARTAQLLLEDWMSTGGSTTYDPAALGLGFALDGGAYVVTVDDVPMMVKLNWKDVDHDADASVTLRELSVTVEFADADSSEPVRPVVMTTYVRTDASGG
jgi:type II secretory pathway pseudopilin PulG